MEFKKVVVAALAQLNNHRQVLLKALAIPFFAYLTIDLVSLPHNHPGLGWFLYVSGTAIQVILAITIHRVVLLGPGSVSTWGITSWSKRESFFALHLIGMLVMPMALSSVIHIIGNSLTLVALVLILWLISRISLVFPGIAVDKGVSFNLSWEMTKNYQMLMFWAVTICPLLLAILHLMLKLIPHTYLLVSFISTLILVIEVAVLSMAYKLISEDVYKKD